MTDSTPTAPPAPAEWAYMVEVPDVADDDGVHLLCISTRRRWADSVTEAGLVPVGEPTAELRVTPEEKRALFTNPLSGEPSPYRAWRIVGKVAPR